MQRLDEREDAGGVRVERHPEADGHEHAPEAGRCMVGDPMFGDPPVDRRAEPDADEQVRPDLEQDRAHLLDPHVDAVVPGELRRRIDRFAVEARLEHERLDPLLEAEPAEHVPGDDRDGRATHDVQHGDLPPEQPEQHHDGDLVDEWAGDQEAHRHAEGNPRGDESDERGHRRARAERCDDAQAGCHDVADALAASAQQSPCAFDRHEAPRDGDDEDHAGEQQRDLGGVVEKEVDGATQAGVGIEPGDVVDDPVPPPQVHPVGDDPEHGSAGEQQRSAGGGPHRMLDECRRVHHITVSRSNPASSSSTASWSRS